MPMDIFLSGTQTRKIVSYASKYRTRAIVVEVDIVEHRVEDASPIEPNSPQGYVERYIHSDIYKRYPEIQGVVHSHSPAVLPFMLTAVDLCPCVYMGGFLGNRVLKYDIAGFYSEEDVRDLLIRN
ncbi:hypothetical protein AnigIFM60653_011945 [Aspergillus niger]|nr:hypothetical protein AnigIFM60653_011945 [Aspergillus niger]